MDVCFAWLSSLSTCRCFHWFLSALPVARVGCGVCVILAISIWDGLAVVAKVIDSVLCLLFLFPATREINPAGGAV
jgi:hypothetical protein